MSITPADQIQPASQSGTKVLTPSQFTGLLGIILSDERQGKKADWNKVIEAYERAYESYSKNAA